MKNEWVTECNVCHGAIPHSLTRELAVVRRDIHIVQTGHEYNDITILPMREWTVLYEYTGETSEDKESR